MSEWRDFRLGDALTVKHGFAFKSEYFGDAGSLIVLTPGNFHDGGGFKSKSGAEKFYEGPVPEGYVLNRDDVVVAMTEQAHGLLGSSATIPSDDTYLHNQRIGLVRVADYNALNLRFVYHLFNSAGVRAQLQATATGSKVRHTAPERIEHVRVLVPDVDTQRRIAEILDAIDDLIENNRRRIALLEQMAQAIYREWFVHFRYHGYEDDELVDSPLGPVPAGWDVAAISDVVETLGGGTPSKKEPSYWDDGTITWFTPSDLTKTRSMFISSSDARITSDGLARSSARLFPPRSVLMTSRATLGVISISAVEGSTNQGFIVCVPNETLSEYHLYFWMLENVREFETLATGATFKEITRGAFRKFPIAVPPSGIGREFDKSVSPMAVTIERLLGMNSGLGRLRDMLLPKLVTGAIDVSQLDLDALLEEPAA